MTTTTIIIIIIIIIQEFQHVSKSQSPFKPLKLKANNHGEVQWHDLEQANK
jgi:hypothetical protein